MTVSQWILAHLWWGPLRRPFEAVVRRTVGKRPRVIAGPLGGLRFAGGLAQLLGIYELHIQEAILAHLGRGDVFYDVGGHYGYFSLLGGRRVGPSGQVYTLEPLPENAAKIEQALAANRIGNITLLPVAAADRAGVAELHLTADGNSTTPSLLGSAHDRVLRVPTTTLDALRAERRAPALIKLDVEGAESLVLQGAQEVLAQRPAPAWIVEIHSAENDRDVRRIFAEHGYHLRSLVSYARNKGPYPRHIFAARDERV
jgi:FkbM family methyltransferase